MLSSCGCAARTYNVRATLVVRTATVQKRSVVAHAPVALPPHTGGGYDAAMNLHEDSTCFINCGRGLTPWLQREIGELGYSVRPAGVTGVETDATLTGAMRLNLCLRTGLNVLYLLKDFTARTPDDLYRQAAAVAWEDMIAPEEYLSVVSEVRTPAIDNSMFASLKTKDAIVDRIAARVGRRPDSGPRRTGVVVNLFWQEERCRIYLNTSGEKLSDRGYRRLPHSAPLRETLAAGLLLAAGYDGAGPLVAPMCGSGTIPIEAALLASRRPPGFLRDNFSFMHVRQFDKRAWLAVRAEAGKGVRKAIPAPIVASDIDAAAVRAARKNAQAAGVDHLIEFHVCDFAETPIPPGEGIVLLNPPYGERLGEVRALETTYKRIGDFFKQKCAGYTGCIFTGNTALAKKVGLRAARRTPFWNARIECRLLEYPLYKGARERR